MADTLNEIRLDNSLLTARYMPRPRVERILNQVSECKLVYVIAGAGYGKTQAVHNYIHNQTDAVVRWMQLTESDNTGSRYWESLTRNIAFDNPDLADKLRKLGFPETLSRFKQFAEILRTTEHRSQKTYLVLDDFHLISSKQALTFAERCAHLQIPGACVILISRKEPEINAVTLFSKGWAGLITEEDLRFTESEIADFFSLRGIPYSADYLPRFAGITKGWALAVSLLSIVLERMPHNLELAKDIMAQNIFKLFETEAFGDFSESIQKKMIMLSLTADLPLASLHEIFEDDSFIRHTPQLSSFLWFDSFIGDYRIHPLYLEFLQSRQDSLSEEEKLSTYRRAAEWCADNNFGMDAVKYYAKSHQYEKIIDLFLSLPYRLPTDACEYYLQILEDIKKDVADKGNEAVTLLINYFEPNFLIGLGRYEQARALCFDIIREQEGLRTTFSYGLISAAYSKLAYIDVYTCTITHKYDFPEHLKKSVEYYKMASGPPVRISGAYAIADIRSFACLVGEGAELSEFDRFVETTGEAMNYIPETYHKMFYGYDDLAAAELAFFRNRLDAARNHAHDSILKARVTEQYSIEAAARQYLLRIAIHEGNYPLVSEIMNQLRERLDESVFWNRRLLYDLFAGSFYIHIGLSDKVPIWLGTEDEKETASEARIPTRELIIVVRYYLSRRKYQQALTILYNSYPRAPEERFLFGELILSILLAYTRLRTGDTPGAAREFENAYRMSFNGEFEMPFIELGRSFRPLATAVAQQQGRVIPKEWLFATERKAGIYAKMTSVIRSAVRTELNMTDAIHLSERELEVLNDMYNGLSREEIATKRYLSINTVKKILQSIYIKLDASNNIDAIRIAIDMKLIN